MNSIELTQDTPKRGHQSNSGFLNVIAMRSTQRASMPPMLDRNTNTAKVHNVNIKNPFADAADVVATADDDILLFQEDDQLLLIDDLDDDENLLLNDDYVDDTEDNNYNDNMSVDNSGFPPEFSQIEDKFQKSQLVVASRPMIVEEDREEDEEEKKVVT